MREPVVHCGECAHVAVDIRRGPSGSDMSTYTCHRRSAQVDPDPNVQTMLGGRYGVWPEVEPEEWCAEGEKT